MGAQDIGQQPVIDSIGCSVDGVIGRHNRLGMAFLECHFPVRQEIIEQVALVDHIVPKLAAILDIVNREKCFYVAATFK